MSNYALLHKNVCHYLSAILHFFSDYVIIINKTACPIIVLCNSYTNRQVADFTEDRGSAKLMETMEEPLIVPNSIVPLVYLSLYSTVFQQIFPESFTDLVNSNGGSSQRSIIDKVQDNLGNIAVVHYMILKVCE